MDLTAGKISRIIAMLTLLVSSALAAAVPVPSAKAASSPGLTDYDWQALYIVKFGLSYVEWPQTVYNDDKKVVNVCIFGDSPAFIKSLKNLQPKAEQQKLQINIRVEGQDINGCNIAYIPRNTDYKDIIARIGNNPVLTVAPIGGFAANNGIVEFTTSETEGGAGAAPFNNKVKVNFKINHKVATASNLKIAPDLLELSDEVIR